MKNYRFLLVLLVLFSYNSIRGQTTLTKKDFDEAKKLKEKFQDAGHSFAEIDKDSIGSLKFTLENIRLYDKNHNAKGRIAIDSIYMSIKDGYINDITIYSKNKTFTNKKAPIAITNQRFMQIDRLHQINDRTSLKKAIVKDENPNYIIFQSIVELVGYKKFIPENDNDIRIYRKSKFSQSYKLIKNVGVNTFFDIRLYTDATALLFDQENGLVQIEAKHKANLHRKNIPQCGVAIVQYVKSNFSFSKFDSKDEYVSDVLYSDTKILQKSYLTADVALNLVNGWLDFKSMSEYYLDFGVGIAGNKFIKATDSLNVTSTNVFLDTGVKLQMSQNMGMNFSAKLIRLFSPATQYQTEHGSPYFDFMKFSLDCHVFSKKNRSTRFFGRINFISPTSSSRKDEQFFQVQIGCSLLLSEILKKNE